jgi:Ser/Thr protein kinase RdoA (MazF antagonist)
MSGHEVQADAGAEAMVNSSLRVVADEVTLAEAEQLVREHYGIVGEASRLTSERDQNFKITAQDGREYAFKVSNPAEDSLLNDFQVSALIHIAAVDPDLPVPRACHALGGQAHLRLPFGENSVRSVRLISYLPGVPLHTVERTASQRGQLATLLARLGLALRGFFHPAAGHDLAWDMKNTSRVRVLLPHIADAGRRAVAEHFLDNFEVNAKPLLPRLRAQVIHNDLNLHNVLVDPDNLDRIAGILDFGDMVFSSLVNDVAVGTSYHLEGEGDPWDRVAAFVSAYHAVSPLERGEVDLLFDLVAARFVLTVAITGWRAARYPENSAYILKNNARAWDGLAYMINLPRDQAQARLRAACHME